MQTESSQPSELRQLLPQRADKFLSRLILRVHASVWRWVAGHAWHALTVAEGELQVARLQQVSEEKSPGRASLSLH